MRLKDLEIFTVAPPAPGWGGRYWIFLKLTTDSGVVGFGEAYSIPFISPKIMVIPTKKYSRRSADQRSGRAGCLIC